MKRAGDTQRVDTGKIESFMAENNYSKRAFAKKCGIAYGTLAMVLNDDEENISIVSLLKIASVMEVRFCELFLRAA